MDEISFIVIIACITSDYRIPINRNWTSNRINLPVSHSPVEWWRKNAEKVKREINYIRRICFVFQSDWRQRKRTQRNLHAIHDHRCRIIIKTVTIPKVNQVKIDSGKNESIDKMLSVQSIAIKNYYVSIIYKWQITHTVGTYSPGKPNSDKLNRRKCYHKVKRRGGNSIKITSKNQLYCWMYVWMSGTYYLLCTKLTCMSFRQFRLRRQHILLVFQMTSNRINSERAREPRKKWN